MDEGKYGLIYRPNPEVPILAVKFIEYTEEDLMDTPYVKAFVIEREEGMMEWNEFNPDDVRLDNHCGYLVSDGQIVTIGYYDLSGWVGYEDASCRNVTHWMEIPNPPKREE